MKYLFFIIAISIVIGMSFNEMNAKENVKVFFKKGGHISGELIDSVPGVSIKIKPEDFPAISYQLGDILKIVYYKNIIKTNGSVGIGLGVPFGVFGGCLELNSPTGHLSGFVGLGTTILAGMGWSVGVRAYLNDFYSSFQPRVSLLYGKNSLLVIEKTDYFDTKDTEFEAGEGINVGAGFKWMFGETHSWGIDADLFYMATSTLDSRIDQLKKMNPTKTKDLSRIDISFGFIWSL